MAINEISEPLETQMNWISSNYRDILKTANFVLYKFKYSIHSYFPINSSIHMVIWIIDTSYTKRWKLDSCRAVWMALHTISCTKAKKINCILVLKEEDARFEAQ